MPDMMVLNSSVVSARFLLASGVGLFLGKSTMVAVGY